MSFSTQTNVPVQWFTRLMPRLLKSHAALFAVVFSIAACLTTSLTHAAEEDTGYWTTVSAGVPIAERWSAALLVQTRSTNDFGDLERTVIRPSVSYTANNLLRLTVGYDAHFIELARDRVEHRIWQQWSAKWLAAPVSVSSRIRLEERFLEDVDGTAVRLRLKGQMVVPISESNLSAVASNEYFVGLNDLDQGSQSGFDQNRAYVGLRYKVNKRHTVQIGYQLQHIDRGSREDISVHQLQLSLSLN